MAVTKNKVKTPKKNAPKPSAKRSDVARAEKASEDMSENAPDEDERAVLESTDYSGLIEQITSEYETGWWFIKPKWDEWALRIKLYNNQKRDKEAVGDNTLFTIFQTVIAELYKDVLNATFAPRESGDEETAENLTVTAEYDYEEMEKDVLDYEWDWEAGFFGRSLMALMEFDRKRMVPVPQVWNVMTVLRDPYATSVNGDRKGKGRARFLGREIRMTKAEMDEMDVYFNYKNLKSNATSTMSLVDENMRITADAAGLSDTSKFQNLKGDNQTYRLLEWFTMWKGKRVFVTLADNKKRVIRYQELDDIDIPIIDRVLYPMPTSWDGVSVPDLVEDKQRGRAVATNLALKGVKASLHPMYLFDATKIPNRNDLNFEFNKFVEVNGNPTGAVIPMQREQIKQDVSFILETLSNSAERATASPDTKQGARPQEGGTATRDALIDQGSDTRYSLSAKIFGWSEKRFWKQWYKLYKEHFVDGIDEKSVRITGALGAQWRPLTRENLITNADPDVKVESKVVGDAKRFNELQQFRTFMQFIATDPTANLRFGLRYMAKLSGLSKDVIDRLLPPTIEEIRADEENKTMRKNGLSAVKVLASDDHNTHIEIHNKMEDTPSKIAHINAHKRAMMLAKQRPDLFPQQDQTENADVKGERFQSPSANQADRPVSNTPVVNGRTMPTR